MVITDGFMGFRGLSNLCDPAMVRSEKLGSFLILAWFLDKIHKYAEGRILNPVVFFIS
jgi:hypothetical protein